MKKMFAVLIVVIFTISACSPSSTPLPVPSATPIEMTVPAPTQTSEPTATQIPSPTSIPLTPTLDVSSLVTFTPAAPAQCPAVDDGKRLSMGYVLQNPDSTPEQITNLVQEFLNNGGSLKAAYEGLDKGTDDIKAFVLDLTNDGRQELVLQRSPYLFIFGCDAGGYKIIYQIDNKDGEVYVYALQDYNLNGVPEIIFRRNYPPIATDRTYIHSVYSYYFLEWNGLGFQNILTTESRVNNGLLIGSDNPLKIPAITVHGEIIATDAENQNSWEVADYDNNGLMDIRIVGGDSFINEESYKRFRQAILTLSWNGTSYVPFKMIHKAVYQIDVVRDADSAFLQGDYQQALPLYVEAIQNEKLAHWYENNYFVPLKRIQAYAYYRMMLTYVVQGDLENALECYTALQNQFANDEDASPFAMMAARFWDNYQATQNIASSCDQVVSYAQANPVVLSLFRLYPYSPTPGYDYEGRDLCPIK
jgi:hypothetical protein